MTDRILNSSEAECWKHSATSWVAADPAYLWSEAVRLATKKLGYGLGPTYESRVYQTSAAILSECGIEAVVSGNSVHVNGRRVYMDFNGNYRNG